MIKWCVGSFRHIFFVFIPSEHPQGTELSAVNFRINIVLKFLYRIDAQTEGQDNRNMFDDKPSTKEKYHKDFDGCNDCRLKYLEAEELETKESDPEHRAQKQKTKADALPHKPLSARVFEVARTVVILMWILLIIISYLYKDQISVDDIFHYTPSNSFLAATVLLFFFALKSMSMVIYVGLLYAAAGIMFPLHWAILVNTLGTAIMVTIPYFIGKSGGAEFIERTIRKYPKMAMIKEIRKGSDFWFSFIVRLVGMFPSDIISLYMGSIEVRFWPYLWSCILGFLPPVITFSVMGMSLADIHSPNFKIALGVEIACVISSAILGFFYVRKLSKNRKEREE